MAKREFTMADKLKGLGLAILFIAGFLAFEGWQRKECRESGGHSYSGGVTYACHEDDHPVRIDLRD